MTTPTAEIAKLDRQLATKGDDVLLRRRIGTTGTFVSLPCRAAVRGYSPQELVGDITQQDAKVILSPTPLAAGTWPGAAGGPAYPQNGDVFLIGGKPRKVESATPIRMAGQIVRIEARVLGGA
jgi:hypothetical protein